MNLIHLGCLGSFLMTVLLPQESHQTDVKFLNYRSRVLYDEIK